MRAVLACGVLWALMACGGDKSSLPVSRALSAEGVRHHGLSYSPDGKRMAWWAPRTDSVQGYQLWVSNADLTAQMKLPVVAGGRDPVVWSPDGTRIAATSSQFGFANVVVVPAAGGEAKRLTSGAGIQLPIAWHRDGDRLAFLQTAEGGTFRASVVSMATGKSVPLVPGEKRPHAGAWSPDGTRIAYQLSEGARNTIWVADSAGGGRKALTTEGFERFSINGPAWSPDGKELLYESRRTGTADLWIVSVDGGAPRQLTRDVRNDYNAVWSSDGKWVAFVSDRGRQQDVWVVPAAGGQEIRVTDTPLDKDGMPAWRPGSHELAFAAAARRERVWAIDVADGKERQITPDSVRIQGPALSPDGRQVALEIVRSGGISDLAVVPLAGGTPRMLVAGSGYVGQLKWSPDGSKIAFGSDRGGTDDIWVVDAAGGTPRQVENWPGYESSPAWSPDGKLLYFTSNRDARLNDVWAAPAAGGEPVRVTRDGGINFGMTQPGGAWVVVSVIGRRAGEFGVSRLDPDGTLRPIYERTNAFPGIFMPKSDSIVIDVQQPNGQMQATLFSVKGGAGRTLLPPNVAVAQFSPDGRMLVHRVRTGASDNLAVLNIADGTTRRLTTTTDNDAGAEWTPDGKSVVFRRWQTVARIYSADLTRQLANPK